MLLYTVSIDYKEFAFEDPTLAVSFAETAAQHMLENYTVKITITTQENEGEENAAHIFDETKN